MNVRILVPHASGQNTEEDVEDRAPATSGAATARLQRADRVVSAHFPGVGRRPIAALFARGAVTIDGRAIKKGHFVAPGAALVLTELPIAHADAPPRPNPDLALSLLHCDDTLLALAKPGGQPSHPLRADESHTAANALVARYPECARASTSAREAGLAHRLDIGTSGVLLAARDQATWRALRRAFRQRAIDKRYWALTRDHLGSIGNVGSASSGTVRESLIHRGVRMAIARPSERAQALDATTEWRVIERYPPGYKLIECSARTGRMHQIRVHLAHLDTPIVNDVQYGGEPAPTPMTGFFLHARSITLRHPTTGRNLTIEAPLPTDRAALLDALRTVS